MLVALVMLGVTACEQDVTIDTPKSEGLSFYAEIAMTRADLVQGTDDSKWTTVWEGNETLYVNEFKFTNTESEPSKFTCTTEGVTALVGKPVTITMNSDSVPTTGKGIMIEHAVTAFDPTSTISLTAKNAFFRFTYTGDVTFTLSESLFVVGGEVANTIKVTANGDTWVSVLPGTANLTFEGSTNGETKTKDNFNIVAGKIYNLGTLTDDTVYVYKPITSLVDLTDGEYIIAGIGFDGITYYALPSTTTASSSKINGEAVTVTENVVLSANATGKVWSIKKDGNSYTIYNGTNYLYYNTSTNIGVRNTSYTWTASYIQDGWEINASTGTNRHLVFQKTDDGETVRNRFGGYTSYTTSGYTRIQLFKKMAENEEPYKTPIITTDFTSKSVGVEGDDFEIAVTATNFDVKDIVVEKDVEWFTATHNGEGKIAVSVAENATTSVREGYITISYPGATSVVVTLSQAANAVKATIAEFLAAAEDDTLYELSGTIISVVNETYGNFTIMDDTGEVYIYGLCSPEGVQKYWEESGAKLGDDITIKTIRTSYNDTAQGENAIFVELVSPGTRAFWTFDKTNVNFTSVGGSELVTIEAYNLNDTVNVSSDNEQFSATYDEGELTITAAENTTTEVISGNITVTCGGTLSQTITVSQAAQSTGEEASSWTLVADVSNLAVDDQVVLVASNADYALSTNQKTNNRGAAAITKSGETVTFGDDVQILTLEAGTVDGTFAFYTGSGYLYAASSSNNYLRTETTLSNNSSWKITITDGNTSIVAQGTYTHNVMRYNPNNGSPLFACYSSASQTAITIYKLAK